MSGRRILVTGAAGQIGSELVPALRERYGAEQVVASDVRLPSAATAGAQGPFEHIDCTHIREIDYAVRRHEIDTVFHLAALLAHLRAMTKRFERGLVERGYETIPGPHPVVPLLVRDTAKTRALVAHLQERGVLATGLGYPVVPRGEEEIRFQISADHTEADIDEALAALPRLSSDGSALP